MRAQDGLCATVTIQIQQKASLERQAFIAEMAINNGLTTSAITGVGVNVLFSDAAGNAVVATTDPNNTSASFFLRQDSLSGINAVDGSGTVAPSSNATIRWLIIPAPGTGGTSPSGVLYSVGATLTYTLDGEVQTVNVAPANIIVLPQPLLQLDYFLPNWVYADDPFTLPVEPPVPFTLGVRVTNNGAGIAKNLTIDSAQPKIVDNKQGLLIDFQLLDSYVNDQPAAKTLLLNFGDVAPQQAKMGRWDMETTLSGQFVDFSASFTHADSLGGALTSLISGVTTHFLVHDVLVDLPGRDGVLDFLALDGGVLRVYESDGPSTDVVDSSVNASLSSVSGGQATLTFPSGSGLVYVRLTDPFAGQAATVAATRSDGKALPAANAWFSKERNTSGNWVYYVNLFDSNSTGKYTLVTQGATNTASITGSVFNDANSNGVQDPGESGMSGVGVHLHGNASAATVDLDTITDSNGNFQFGNLAAGTYSLTVSAVANYVEGTATSGSAGGASSPGAIQSIQLSSGTTASGYRFAKIPQTASASSDFALAFAAGASHVAVGGNLTVTATLSNAGPVANNASVAFQIPPGLIMGGATASNGSFDAGSRTWQVGTLGSGGTATLALVVQGKTAGSQTIQATAVAGSAATDPNLQNNSASAAVTVDDAANLTLFKSGPATVVPGASMAYTLALGNSGGAASAASATVTDVLPVGVSYVNAVPGTNVSQVACTGTTTLTCTVTLANALAAHSENGAATFTVNTSAPATTGTITNYAAVDPTGGVNPPAPGTSCSSSQCGQATTVVSSAAAQANLTLAKSAPATAGTGSQVGYTLALGNSGQAQSGTTVTVADALPAGMVYVSAVPGTNVSSVTCTGAPTLSCTVTLTTPLSAGAASGTATFAINATAPNTAGTITNYASVDPAGGTNPPSPGTGCTPAASCGSATTTVSVVTPPAAFTLAKKAPAAVTVGSALAYEIDLGNGGQSTSGTAATITDTLPTGVVYVGAVAGTNVSNVTCTGTTTLTCTATLGAPLAAGAANGTATFTINTTAPSAVAAITNYASVDPAGGTSPPSPGASCMPASSCGSATTTVGAPPPVLTLAKSAPSTANTGSTLVYEIDLGNSGQGASGTTATITDVLPAGMGYVSASPGTNVSSVSCTGTTTLICTATLTAPLSAGAANGAAKFTINTTTPGTAATITNYASVDSTGGTSPPAPGSTCTTSNCGSATTTVSVLPPQAVLTLAKKAPATANTGSVLAYEIDLGNSGQGASGTTVTISDVLPAGVTYVNAQPWTNMSSVACSGTTTLTCTATLTAPLSAGAVNGAAMFMINTTAPTTAGTITNYASVDSTGGTNPPAPGSACTTSNCGSATTTINLSSPAANITLWATGPASADQHVLLPAWLPQYTVGLGNSGQLASPTTITLSVLPPPAATYSLSAVAGNNVSDVQCPQLGTPYVTCTVTLINPLPPGADPGSATFSLKAPPFTLSPSSVTAYLSVDPSGGTSPPVPGPYCVPLSSCSAVATNLVGHSGNPGTFALSASASAFANTNGVLAYTVSFGNPSSAATGTSLTFADALPSGATFAGILAGQGVTSASCTGTTLLTCSVTLAAGIPARYWNNASVVIYTSAPATPGAITNYVSIDPTGGTNPPVPGGGCVPSASCSSATTWLSDLPKQPANITLTKTGPSSASSSAPPAYVFGLGNSGQSTSGNIVTVADWLPAGMTGQTYTPGIGVSSVSCSGSPLMICTITLSSPLQPGAAAGTAAFTVSTNVANVAATLTNYASVDPTGGTNPPQPGANCSPAISCGSATTTIGVAPPPAVLTLSKQAPATANAGSTLAYEIDLGNSGQGASGTTATITDVLPAGVSYISGSPGTNVSSVTCTGTTTLTCAVTLAAALNAGAANGAAVFTINTTAPSAAGTITNYASVDPTGGTNPPAPGSACTTSSCGSATTTVNVPPPAVFTLAKQAPATANTGSALAYEIDLGNSGQGTSGTTATISDVLPVGVSYVSASPGTNVSGVACTGTTTLTCTATLAAPLSASVANGAAKFTINTTAPSASGTITNYASVDSTGGANPPAPGSTCTTSNCGSATTTVNAPPPATNITLWAAGTTSAAVVSSLLNLDRSIVYEVGLGNSGQLASPTTITVAVTIPSLMTLTSANVGANVSSVQCQGWPTGVCTITLIAPLQAGADLGSATFRLGMISRSTTPRVLTSYLSVDPTGGANPPAPGANCAPVSSCGAIATNIFGRTSDSVAFTLSTKASAFARTNGALAYTIGFGNAGSNSSGTSLTFADALPSGATFAGLMLGDSVASASCAGTTLLTCSVTLNGGLSGSATGNSWNYASLVIYISAPATPGVITNYLSVDPTGGANPPTPGAACTQNPSCSSATTMLSDLPAGSANITLTKTGPSSASSNAPPAYVISLGNSGHSASGNVVTVADLLPAGMTAPTFTPGVGVSSVACQNLALICTVTLSSPLQPGAVTGTAAFTVSTNVANTAATLTNYASVDPTGGTNPPLPGANCSPATSCSSATTTISAVPVFTLSKQAPATANTGSTLVYEIDLGNSGQSTSGTSATITDALPAGVSYVSASPGTNVSSVACTGATTLTCTAILTAPLSANAASGAAKFTINTTAPSTAGTITNYASVDSTGGASPPAPGSTCTTANCGSATTTINSAPPATNIILSASGPTNIATSNLTQYSGDADTYQISLGNSGQLASPATITVTESVPSGMSLAGANAGTNVSSVQCQGSPTAVCTVTLINPLPAGAALGSATLNLTYYVTSSTAQTVTHYYSVDPSGGASPPAPGAGCTPASSCGAVTTNLIGRSGNSSAFALATTVSPFAHTNGALAYNISLGNTGATASGTSLTFAVALPNGATFTGIVAGDRVTSATCTGTTSLTCSVTLASGLPANSWKAASLVIYVSTPATAGVITNYLSIDPSGGTSPPAPGPACTPTTSCDSAATRVTDLPAGSANITLIKTGSSSATSNSPPAYVIGLGNSGQSASGTTITVADLLPSGMTAQTYIPGTGVSSVACSGSSLLICTVTLSAPLQPGAAAGTAAFTVYTNVANAAATLINYASVDPTGGTNPPQPGPNCSPSSSCGSASTAISVSSNSTNDRNWFESLAGLIPPPKKESWRYEPLAIDRPVRRLFAERQSTSFFMSSRISTQGSM